MNQTLVLLCVMMAFLVGCDGKASNGQSTAPSKSATFTDVRRLLEGMPALTKSQLSDSIDRKAAIQAIKQQLCGATLDAEWPTDIRVSDNDLQGDGWSATISLRPVSQRGWLGIATRAFAIKPDGSASNASTWSVTAIADPAQVQRFEAHKSGQTILVSAVIEDAGLINDELYLILSGARFTPRTQPKVLIEKAETLKTFALRPVSWNVTLTGEPPDRWTFVVEAVDTKSTSSVTSPVTGSQSESIEITRIVSKASMDQFVKQSPKLLKRYPVLQELSLDSALTRQRLPLEAFWKFEPPASSIQITTDDPDAAHSILAALESSQSIEVLASQLGEARWNVQSSNSPLQMGSMHTNTLIIDDARCPSPNPRLISGSHDWRSYVTSAASDATAPWIFNVLKKAIIETEYKDTLSNDQACDLTKAALQKVLDEQLIGNEFQSLAAIDTAIEMPDGDRSVQVTAILSLSSTTPYPEVTIDKGRYINIKIAPVKLTLSRTAWHELVSGKNASGMVVVRSSCKAAKIDCAGRPGFEHVYITVQIETQP